MKRLNLLLDLNDAKKKRAEQAERRQVESLRTYLKELAQERAGSKEIDDSQPPTSPGTQAAPTQRFADHVVRRCGTV